MLHCFLLSVALCHAISDKPVMALAGIHATVATYDMVHTENSLAHGGTENNPLWRPIVSHPAAAYATGGLLLLGETALAEKMHRSHAWVRHIWWLPQTLGIAGNGWGIACYHFRPIC